MMSEKILLNMDFHERQSNCETILKTMFPNVIHYQLAIRLAKLDDYVIKSHLIRRLNKSIKLYEENGFQNPEELIFVKTNTQLKQIGYCVTQSHYKKEGKLVYTYIYMIDMRLTSEMVM